MDLANDSIRVNVSNVGRSKRATQEGWPDLPSGHKQMMDLRKEVGNMARTSNVAGGLVVESELRTSGVS